MCNGEEWIVGDGELKRKTTLEAIVITQAKDACSFDKGGGRDEEQKEMDVILFCKGELTVHLALGLGLTLGLYTLFILSR